MAIPKKKLAAFIKGGGKPPMKIKVKFKPGVDKAVAEPGDKTDYDADLDNEEEGEDAEDEGGGDEEGRDAEDEGGGDEDSGEMEAALQSDVRVVDRMARMTKNGNPGEEDKGQPAKGLAALKGALGEEVAGGLEAWAKAHDWEDFLALAERIGADDPEAMAGWLQAVKKGTGVQ